MFAVVQNLKDAGCDRKAVEKFIRLRSQGDTDEQLRLLSRQRDILLERIHCEEKKIDCLDYLVYQIKKKAI